MFEIYVSAADVTVKRKETITEGRAGLRCKMSFSEEWEGLAKTAVFEGAESRDVAMTGDTVTIPAECLSAAGYPLRVGVYGKNPAGTIVIPTVYAKLGKVESSVYPSGREPAAPTPDVAAQIQQQAANAVRMAREVKVAADLGAFNGKDGGWYTPALSQPDGNTLRVSFAASRENMPAVPSVDLALAAGTRIFDAGALCLRSSDGTVWGLTVDDNGTLRVEEI